MQAEVKGGTMPVLEVLLDPGEALVSDRGELSWMSANMRMTQTTGTGGAGGHGGGLMASAASATPDVATPDPPTPAPGTGAASTVGGPLPRATYASDTTPPDSED